MKEITLELRGQNAPEAIQKLEASFSNIDSARQLLGDSQKNNSGIRGVRESQDTMNVDLTNEHGGLGSVSLSKADHTMSLNLGRATNTEGAENHLRKMLQTYKAAGINPDTIQMGGNRSVLTDSFDDMKKEVFGNSPKETAQTQATRAATSAPTPPQRSTTPKSTTTAPAAVTASAPSETATGAKPTAPTTQPSTPPLQNTDATAYYDKSGQLLWIHSPDSMLPKKNTPGALDDKGMYQIFKGDLVLPGKTPSQEELNSLTKVPFKTNAHSVKNEYDKWNPRIQKDAGNAFKSQQQQQQNSQPVAPGSTNPQTRQSQSNVSGATPTTITPQPGGMTYCRFYDATTGGKTPNNTPDPNYIFANFKNTNIKPPHPNAAKPMTVDGETFKTPEHYFQAQKYPPGHPQRDKIIGAESSADALKFGQEKGAHIQPPMDVNKWNNGGDIKAMQNVVKERYKQDPDFKKALDSTDNAYILEDTYHNPFGNKKADAKWGGGADGKGKNELGLTLMQVRNEEWNKKNPGQPPRPTDRADLEALRAQAQKERDDMNAKLGGAGNTQGKSLNEIQQALQNPQLKQQPSQAKVTGAKIDEHLSNAGSNNNSDVVNAVSDPSKSNSAITGMLEKLSASLPMPIPPEVMAMIVQLINNRPDPTDPTKKTEFDKFNASPGPEAATSAKSTTAAPAAAVIAHVTPPRVLARAKTVLDKAAKGVEENATLTHEFKPVVSYGANSRANAVEKAGNHVIAMAKAHKESGRENPLNLVVDPKQKKSEVGLDAATAGGADLVAAAVDALKNKPMSDDDKATFLADVKKYADDRLSSDEKKNVSLNGQPLATPPQLETGATASAAEAESEEEEHPTYTHLADTENQTKINEKLEKEGEGYKFATDEEGKVHFHGPDETKIAINKDGSYSGTTIPLEEIKPDHPQYQNSVDKMERDMQAIIKAHENGPNAGEPLDLSMGLSDEEMKENPQFVKDVQARLNKNLTEDQKKNITFNGKEIVAPAQDKTASLTATGQTPSSTPVQSTTPTPTPSTTPTPAPQPGGSANKEESDTMQCKGYYDDQGRVSHVEIPEGPQKGIYENVAREGHANMQLMKDEAGAPLKEKPAFINEQVQNGQLHEMTVPYPKNQQEASLTNLSANTAFKMDAINNERTSTPTELTQSTPGVAAEFTHDESKSDRPNVHGQTNRNTELAQRVEAEGGLPQNGGFGTLAKGKDQAGESYASLKNMNNGGNINIHDNKGGDDKVKMTSHAPPPPKPGATDHEVVEQQANHHANHMKGMMSMMQQLTGKGNPFSAMFSIAQGAMSGELHKQILDMVSQMMTQHLNDHKSSLNVSNMTVNGKDVPHEPSTAKSEKKVHFADDHKGHDKENAHHTPAKTAHAAKPKPGHGSHKPGDEDHPSQHNANQSLKPRNKGKGGGGA